MNNKLQKKTKNEVETPARRLPPATRPPVDIAEDEDSYTVVADIPGVTADTLDVTVEAGLLTIEGTVVDAVPEGYSLVAGGFAGRRYRRTFRVEDEVNADGIKAAVSNGVLTLNLPKSETVKPRRITVTAA